MLAKIKQRFINPDGTFNGKMISGTIALIIVLIQQVLAVFGFTFTGNWAQITDIINTILVVLGTLGVVENPAQLNGGTTDEVK